MRWDELESAIASGDRSRALRIALEGWRVERHPRFADLVDAYGSTEPFTRLTDPRTFQGDERWVRIGNDEWLIARDGLRLEIISEHLRYVRLILESLVEADVPIEEVALKLPPGVEAPHPHHDRLAFGALRGVRIVPDAGWAEEL